MPSTVSAAFLFAVAAAGMRWSNSTSASASPMPPLLMPFTRLGLLRLRRGGPLLASDLFQILTVLGRLAEFEREFIGSRT
jgi:hypothetical protein